MPSVANASESSYVPGGVAASSHAPIVVSSISGISPNGPLKAVALSNGSPLVASAGPSRAATNLQSLLTLVPVVLHHRAQTQNPKAWTPCPQMMHASL
jgi:hypothetical protein